MTKGKNGGYDILRPKESWPAKACHKKRTPNDEAPSDEERVVLACKRENTPMYACKKEVGNQSS
jgi:hypothetical protein